MSWCSPPSSPWPETPQAAVCHRVVLMEEQPSPLPSVSQGTTACQVKRLCIAGEDVENQLVCYGNSPVYFAC